MSKKVIQTIIVLMSISLLGIAIIQYFWLKRGTELNSKNFDDKVTFALNRVKQQIEDDANNVETFTNYYNKNRGKSIFKIDLEPINDVSSPLSKYRSEILKNQIGSTAWFLEPSIALNGINISDVENYLKTELEDQDIDLLYDYGIYSNEYEDFIIANGSYTVSIDNEEQFSVGGETQNLYESEYKVNLFSTEGESAAGSLRMFFPKKRYISFKCNIAFCDQFDFIYRFNFILFCLYHQYNSYSKEGFSDED